MESVVALVEAGAAAATPAGEGWEGVPEREVTGVWDEDDDRAAAAAELGERTDWRREWAEVGTGLRMTGVAGRDGTSERGVLAARRNWTAKRNGVSARSGETGCEVCHSRC